MLLDDDAQEGTDGFSTPDNAEVCGYVKFQTDGRRFKTIDIAIYPATGNKNHDLPHISISSREFAVILMADYVLQDLVRTPQRLKATLAHELGHFLTNNPAIPNYVTIDKFDKQTRYLKNYNKTPDKTFYADRYHRAMFSSLLRGGVMYKELSADIAASEYVTVDSLIALHSDKLRHENMAVRIESHNRMAELSRYNESEKPQVEKVLKVNIWNTHHIES